MVSKKKINKTNKSSTMKSQKKCKQCKTPEKPGLQMYRMFKTGSTYCKQCWITIDPGKTSSKKRKKIDCKEIKLCSVLVCDLFEMNSRNEEEFTMEKNEKENTTFKATFTVETKKNDKRPTKTPIIQDEHDLAETKTTKSKEKTETTRRNKKDSELSIEEKVVEKATRNRRHKESEQSIQEEIDTKPTRTRRRKESEQSIQEETELKSSRRGRTRKVSEQSANDESAVKPTRSARSRKNSEQSVQENLIARSVRSTRKRKESEKSLEDKAVEGESVEKTKTRHRKASEQSLLEDVEVNVDADSDSGPASKKLKKSMLKQSSSSKEISQNSYIEGTTKRKRGRSSSVESNSSIRKSARNAKKLVQDLEEIVEIDDETEISKSQTEKVSTIIDVPSKKLKLDKTALGAEHSDAESNASETNIPSLKNYSIEGSTTATTIGTSLRKNYLKLGGNEKVIDTSESEEIDVLKSTDEDTLEAENNEKETQKSDYASSAKDKLENNDPKEQTASKSLVENLLEQNVPEETDDYYTAESTSNKELEKTEESNVILKEPSKEPVEKDTLTEGGTAGEAETEPEKMNVVDTELNTNKQDDVIETASKSSSRRSSLNSSLNSSKSRKSRSVGKKTFKKGEKNDGIVIYDSSDSEVTNHEEPVVTTYTCRVCDKLFDNKFVGLQHELTHMKCLEIKLHKVNKPEKIELIDSDVEIEDSEPDSTNQTENANENDDNDEMSDVKKKEEEMSNENEVTNEKQESFNEGETMKESKSEEPVKEKIEISHKESTSPKNQKKTEELLEKKTRKENDSSIENDVSDVEKVETEESNSRRTRSRRVSKKTEEQSPKKARSRRKTAADDKETEKNVSQAVESDSENIVETGELQETLAAESDVPNQNQSTTSASINVVESNEVLCLSDTENNIQETDQKRRDEIEIFNLTEAGEKENDSEVVQFTEDKEDSEIEETHDMLDKNHEVPECEIIGNNEDVEIAAPIVDEDGESRDVVDVELEASRQAEDSEIEITEVEEDAQIISAPAETGCEQIDLTENDESESAGNKPEDNVIEIEEVGDSSGNIHIDENTGDSVSEINVISAEDACAENESGNPAQNDTVGSNHDENDTTESTEDELGQASLDELLQRKGLQIVDEIPDSVTEGDESEKELNESSERKSTSNKNLNVTTDCEIQLKMSESECTEILETSSKTKQKDANDGIVGECQIIQDVDVVEEVVSNDENNGDVEEVEVESNGNCLNVAMTEKNKVFNDPQFPKTTDITYEQNLQTEPISDDETDLQTDKLQNSNRMARNSHDMPSLDPICEDTDDY